MSIRVEHLSKIYGTQKALDNISFDIDKGEIVGFLGPNGAGKSTMMKILTTYLEPSEGSAFVNDLDVAANQRQVQKSIGYLPEHNPLHLDMYVKEYLAFNADIHGIGKERITEVIELILNILLIIFLIYFIFSKIKSFNKPVHFELNLTSISKSNIIFKTLGFTYLNPHVYSDTVFFLGNFSKSFLFHEKIIFGIGASIASFSFFFLIGYLSAFFSKYAKNQSIWKIINFSVIVFMSILTSYIIIEII